ncbi:7481_t:CDS:2, partial [Gigaspora margarita]
YKLVKQSDKEKGQNKNINLAIVESSEEKEDQKGVKGKQKQSESRKKEALQRKAKIQEQEETNSCKKDKISFNINKELEKEQFEQAESLLNKNTHVFAQKISKEEQIVELEQTDLKALSNMGLKDLVNNKPHEIYIKLDDLISQHEAILEKKVSIATWPWWLQPLKPLIEAYYKEFNNFKNTYLCNLVW